MRNHNVSGWAAAGFLLLLAVQLMRTSVATGTGLSIFLPLIVHSPSEAANPGWIVACEYSHSLRDDPIVSPGFPGAAHLHDFFGARMTNAFTDAELLQAGESNCRVSADHSSYWVPALYADETRVLPAATRTDILVYYRHAGVADRLLMQTIPTGLKIIVGNASAASPDQNSALASGHIVFKCGPGSEANLPMPPAQCDSGVMVVSYKFPNCWDGANLDSQDHISHMAYPSGSHCPMTHPIAIPRLEAFVRYPVGTAPIGDIAFASGRYWTAHMDFFNGWDPAALKRLLERCINAGLDCGKDPIP